MQVTDMHESIIRFIGEQKCATICCTNEAGLPHCFLCFYVFNPDDGLFYFKSSPETLHMKLLAQRSSVAGTILPAKVSIYAAQGLQFKGMFLPSGHSDTVDASIRYHLRYPLAVTIPGDVATIRLEQIKMSGAKTASGKKITWSRTLVQNDLA
jgi:uncharacterized protein YhbP (UPF0306 family)